MPNFYPGYLTPDSVPFNSHCRTFSIPDDVQWLSVFMGALLPLIYPESWQKYGTLTPDESAEVMLNVIWDAYADDYGICPVLPAPYWDTYANVDDQEPEGAEEHWYGELVPSMALRSRELRSRAIVELLDDDDLTWRENLGIWAIAGFIAYSGQIGAAIAFVPFARRFVLKFRGNPLGAIAEIFVDGAKLATLDTASAEDRIKAIDIQLPDDDEHEIWVAVGEDSPPGSTLQVVRKELEPSEVYPDNLRYNIDCDCIQQTYDDGDTWVDQPGQDPRTSPTFLYPPVTADDPRCQAAANMTLFFENLIGTALGVISTGLDLLGVATAIMPAFVELGPFAILFDLGIGLGSALIGLGVDVITSEFTPEFYEALTCVFYCLIEADGSVTPEDLTLITLQVIAEFNPDVYLIMGLCFSLMGNVGLSNAGTRGDAPADCDACDCGWCLEFDFTTGLHGWVIVSSGDFDEGTQVDGVGIKAYVQNDGCSGHGYIQTYIDIGATIDNIDVVEIDQLSPNFDIGGAYYVDQDNGGTLTRRVDWGSFSGSGTVSVAINDGTTYNRINIVDFQCGQDPGNPQVIQKIRFKGFGDPPAIGTPCE